MEIRAQISSVFDLDRCIGCHTCSLSCKETWTSDRGCEYMWWNRVETRPGSQYPKRNADRRQGGWILAKDKLRLSVGGKVRSFTDIFHQPSQPTIQDYYEPWEFNLEHLTEAGDMPVQPAASPRSSISGDLIELEAGPNWNEGLAGILTPGKELPDLEGFAPSERKKLINLEKLLMFHLPRMCSHCLNPSCVASCPSGALYKRGEDGIALIDPMRCRGWRHCVASCPYKEVYFNWHSGQAEKCHHCFPLTETGKAPICFESCVGRVRHIGVLLYDADRISEVASLPQQDLLQGIRSIILNPKDPTIQRLAREQGVADKVITAAADSPVYKLFIDWKLALPLHPEFRTLPMLFYIPPLLNVRAVGGSGGKQPNNEANPALDPLIIRYLAGLFAAQNQGEVRSVLQKCLALRKLEELREEADRGSEQAEDRLEEELRRSRLDRDEAEAIYALRAEANFEERTVLPGKWLKGGNGETG